MSLCVYFILVIMQGTKSGVSMFLWLYMVSISWLSG